MKLRRCGPGERGGVVSRYSTLSEHEDYDWAIVPVDAYLVGLASPALAPMLGTRKLQAAIERHSFETYFSPALTRSANGTLPDGQWRAALATRFDRRIFVLMVETSPADDDAIIAAFNAAPNRSHFNFFYGNCSDQAKSVFAAMTAPGTALGNRLSGLTLETPKGLAKSLVDLSWNKPDLRLRVLRYPQLPGTFGRSREMLFPLENTYRSLGFAPYWFWGGFREVAFGAMVYHELMSPFDLETSARAFISVRAADLTREQARLRARQDAVRHALVGAQAEGLPHTSLSVQASAIADRLAEIRRAKQAEVDAVEGSDVRWRRHAREFARMRTALTQPQALPDDLTRVLAGPHRGGALSRRAIGFLEEHGEFSVDDAHGPWVRLALSDGRVLSAGLSPSQALSGDAALGAFVLAAVIDFNLAQAPGQRADIATLDELVALLARASVTVSSGTGLTPLDR